MIILPGRESFFHVSCLGSYRALLGGPDEGDCEPTFPTPHRGILRISPTNILLTLLRIVLPLPGPIYEKEWCDQQNV